MKRLSDPEIEQLQSIVVKYPGSNFLTLSSQNQIQIELSLRILDTLNERRIIV